VSVQSNTKFVGLETDARDQFERRHWLSIFAKSQANEVAALFEKLDVPAVQVIRAPEIGMVMVRGRAGGAGDPFNLGEMTVTRCAVRLAGGEVGIGYVGGRDKDHAYAAAVMDGMLQSPKYAGHVEHSVLGPLNTRLAEQRSEVARKAAATRVEFFTMVRDRKA